MKKMFFVVTVMILFALVFLGFNTSNQTGKVRIGYTPLVYGQPAFIAQEKGFFEEHELDVEMVRFESATQIVNALISNRIDIVAVSPCISAFAAQEKTDTNLFKIYYYNTDSLEHPISFLLVKKDSDIEELKDLKGRKIGIFPGNILSKISTKLLLKDYLDVEKDISFVEVGPQIQSQAIESGMVDVMFSLEPFATLSLENGNVEILHVAPQLSISNYIPGGCGFASETFVSSNPETAEKIRTSLDKAIDFIRENEDEAKLVFPNYTPLSAELALKVRQPQFVKSYEVDVDKLQEEYDVLFSEGIFSGSMNASDLVFQL